MLPFSGYVPAFPNVFLLFMSLNTPIAFFIFNRPEATQRVFAEIASIQPATLLVVADGPRHAGEAVRCAQARAIAEMVDWDCTVLKNYSEHNLGCKQRVSTGLNWVFTQVEEAIILEDDCVPEPSFFPFCEQMLERYREDERVMMIAGTNYLNQVEMDDSYFFCKYFAVWGWATWRRAWHNYDIQMRDWPHLRQTHYINTIYSQDYMRETVTAWFDSVYNDQVDTWDVQWLYSGLLNNGLCIVPKVNLISNIGVIGLHSAKRAPNHYRPTFPIDTAALRHPHSVERNFDYERIFFEEQFRPKVQPKWRQMLSKVKQFVGLIKSRIQFNA